MCVRLRLTPLAARTAVLIQFRARFLFDFHFHFRMDSIKRTDGQSSFVASSENLFSFSMRDPLWSLPDADADGCWLVVPFRHSLNFKRANAQNRIKCAKCREQTGKSGSSDVWMVGWLAGCASSHSHAMR